jgi:transposase
MGLFLDDRGIPVTIEAFPGNTLDHQTLRPAMKASLNGLDFERYILVADRGMCIGPNLCGIRQDGHGYIVSKSIRKTTKQERKWILEPEGYIEKSASFRYKSREYIREVKDENGKKQTLKEKVVVYWSKKFYDREYYQHKSFLEFIEKLRQNPAAFRITATQARSLKKYFRKEFVNKETGEIVNANELLGMLDEEKLEELTAYMGYYQIVTSELDMEPEKVIGTYHELTRIEDQFREMKGTLETRPVFVRTREHIKAHLLLCMMALTILRVIQLKLVDSGAVDTRENVGWSYGMAGERLQRALRKWRIERMPGDLFRFCDTDDKDVTALLKAFDIKIAPRLYTRGELRDIKSNIKTFKV